MSRRCSLNSSKGVTYGNKVSHSNRKSRRTFRPNLQIVSFFSEALSNFIKLRVSSNTIRSVEHNDGIDNYLLTTSSTKLTEDAVRLKKRISKKVAAKAAA